MTMKKVLSFFILMLLPMVAGPMMPRLKASITILT